MEKLQKTINTEITDLASYIGNDVQILKDAVDESSISINSLKEELYNNKNGIIELKESAERELNNLNERIHL